MVKRNQTIPPHDIDRLPNANSGRSSIRDTQRRIRTATDDVIQSLSGAYENERARQVGEWERVQATTTRHAA